MQQALSNVHELVRKIAEPNAKLYPDASVRGSLWNRNITSIYIAFLFFIFTDIFVVTSNFTLSMNVTAFSVNTWVLVSLMMFCRSYLWIFNVIYVLISVMYGFASFDELPDAPYIYIGYIYLIIVCVLVYSGDILLTIFTASVHVFICMTKFQDRLAILVTKEDPEIFGAKFAKMSAMFFVLMVLTNIALVKTLDKRTIELFRAKFALENALDHQKTFIFSFSHELRNPINSLLGNLQLVVQGENLTTKAEEMINVAKVCGEILLHNINNVLDTGKREIGKLEVNPVPTQVCELVQRAWSIYSELLNKKKLKSQLRIDKNIPAMVKIDSQKVNQILLNLIGNSIKFTEKGSVTVSVSWLEGEKVKEKCFEPIPYDDMDEGLFEKDENFSLIRTGNKSSLSKPMRLSDLGIGNARQSGPSINQNRNEYVPLSPANQGIQGVVKIIVKDTGSGIKKEALEKLFKKFSQVSENVSQRQIGTGLGLFITREICHAMNGEIRAYSKPGVGTTFVACLPTTSVPFENVQRTNSETIIQHLTQRNIKALVADDSPFNATLTSNYFAKFGGTAISVAYNGYDALIQYQECRRLHSQLDIVTLDIDMPIMDGLVACDKIRKFENENNLKPVKIILISGNYDEDQVDEYINPKRGGKHKADCFLRKPVSFVDFNTAIYNLITQE